MKKYDNNDAFLKATQAYENGNFKVAVALFSEAASHGAAWAQNYLGIMYGEGEYVEKDQNKSLFWHKSATRIAKNSSYDYSNVARQYEIMGNRRRAFYWWKKAVAAGDKSAGLELAKRLLKNGRSDSRNRAVELLQIVADAEFPLEISENDCEEAQKLLDSLQETA